MVMEGNESSHSSLSLARVWCCRVLKGVFIGSDSVAVAFAPALAATPPILTAARTATLLHELRRSVRVHVPCPALSSCGTGGNVQHSSHHTCNAMQLWLLWFMAGTRGHEVPESATERCRSCRCTGWARQLYVVVCIRREGGNGGH